MALLDGKQLRDSSLSLNKVSGVSGMVNFITASTMSFEAGAVLRQDDANINIGTDVANKNYVDAVAQGLNIKDAVQSIATGSITLSGAGSLIDGFTISIGDRILVNGQAGLGVPTSSNGIYVVDSGAWSRATDSDGLSILGEVQVGDFVFVVFGDTHKSTGWVLSQSDSVDFDILVGTESQKWVQFSSAGNYDAGDGLVQSGNNFNVNVGNPSVTGLTISLDTVSLINTGVIAGVYGSSQSIPTFQVDAKGRLISAATVSISGLGVIGSAEDVTGYTDGIFTDFTPSTTIGTAVDRFNEMFLLLAPTPPSNWNNAITSISFTPAGVSARQLSSGSPVTIYTDTTPDLTNVDTVGTLSNAKVDTSGLTFSLVNQGVTLEIVTLSGTATTAKSSGYIQHSASIDPYVGVSGQAGFWKGITNFLLTGSLPLITPSSSQRTLQLFHPGTDSPETFNYYIDNPLAVSITGITASIPSMTSYISGVPTLTTSQTITAIGFSVSNVSSYFYAATSVYQINAGHIAGSTGDPNNIPTAYAETGNVSGKTASIQSSQFSDLSFFFSVRGRNSIGTYGSNTTFTSTSHRIDTVSNESSRKTSGSGTYPVSGYNGTYGYSQSLVGSYTEELQLKNGKYVYPSVNYTSVGGPNYSGATGIRWSTFNLGTITNKVAFTLTINGLFGISNQINNNNFYFEVKVDGSSPSKWVDGDSAWSGTTPNPGSTISPDGEPASFQSYPGVSVSVRRIDFGTLPKTGDVIVRIGWSQSLPLVEFTSISISQIS